MKYRSSKVSRQRMILKALHRIVYKNLLCQKMVSDPASTGLAQDYRHSSRQCMYLWTQQSERPYHKGNISAMCINIWIIGNAPSYPTSQNAIFTYSQQPRHLKHSLKCVTVRINLHIGTGTKFHMKTCLNYASDPWELALIMRRRLKEKVSEYLMVYKAGRNWHTTF